MPRQIRVLEGAKGYQYWFTHPNAATMWTVLILPTVKLFLSLGILLLGLVCAWHYLLRPTSAADERAAMVFGDRPWRRLGGGIAAVVAIMFVLGAYVVDIPDRPWPYAIYWAVILGMVVWLGVLAIKDLRHTRRIVRALRAKNRSQSAAKFEGKH